MYDRVLAITDISSAVSCSLFIGLAAAGPQALRLTAEPALRILAPPSGLQLLLLAPVCGDDCDVNNGELLLLLLIVIDTGLDANDDACEDSVGKYEKLVTLHEDVEDGEAPSKNDGGVVGEEEEEEMAGNEG